MTGVTNFPVLGFQCPSPLAFFSASLKPGPILLALLLFLLFSSKNTSYIEMQSNAADALNSLNFNIPWIKTHTLPVDSYRASPS